MAARRARRLFSIAPGARFLREVVDALCSGRLVEGFTFDPAHPLALARVTIYVPTRRAARALRSEFVDHMGGRSAILPVIRPLGESDEDSGFFDDGPDLTLAPPVGQVETLLELASLIVRWKENLPAIVSGFHGDSPLMAPASPADAIWLARDLADILNAMETHSKPWAALDKLDAGDHAEWWQLTLEFLKIASRFWPERLVELDRSSLAAHARATIDAEIARLNREPAKDPIVVAGSTGSIPATADLMAAIADQEMGALVLPGLDFTLAQGAWEMLRPGPDADAATLSHPQFGLAALLARLGATREDVAALGTVPDAVASRNALISTALLPARATEAWSTTAPDPAQVGAALEDVTLIEADNEREEATAVSLAMRLAGDDTAARVALVTPDRNLARRVAVELRRFGIEANDSGGQPLAATSQASLIRLLLEAVMQPGDPVALTALLSHPLARFSFSEADCARAASTLERLALRGTVGDVDIAALAALLEEGLRLTQHTPQWRKRISDDEIALARLLAERAQTAVAALSGYFVRFAPASESLSSRRPVCEWARETVAAVESVAADPQAGLSGLWDGEAGEKLVGLFSDLIASRASFSASGAEWADILLALIASETVKPRIAAHPRIFIWGTLEARLQEVDTVVLAGLNEESWPDTGADGAFLSRSMKMELGLDPPERFIGLAAHDFQMAMGLPSVVLSRSLRSGRAPTIASRWLQRLQVVAGDEPAKAMKARGERLRRQAANLDRRALRPSASRPEPKPAVDVQPKSYSFSEVKTLRRDPYAIYAKKVLRLDPLEPLVRDPGVLERGTLYHAILESFGRESREFATPGAWELMMRIADRHFAGERLPAHIEVLWRPRFDEVARLYLQWESERENEVAERHVEQWGEMSIPGTVCTLRGKADRIDLLGDGTAEIIDFKTGISPSRKEARALLDPQLPLEAAALAAGAFSQIGRCEPSSLKYVRLRGDDRLPVGSLEGYHNTRTTSDDGTFKSAADLGQEAIEQLAGFITVLAFRRRGFASRLIPAKAREFGGDYDHLARVAEWSNAEDDNGDEFS